MEAKTLAALEASIAKWERNAVAEKPSEYLVDATDCALCDEFWHINCFGCPVFTRTGHLGCSGTPYTRAFATWEKWSDEPSDFRKQAAHEAAHKEVAFLKSLLPASLPEEPR